MKRHFMLLLALFIAGCGQKQPGRGVDEAVSPANQERYKMIRFSEDAPPLYPWLLKSDSTRSDWLGIRYDGKILHEPMNILICDQVSDSPDNAAAKLFNACEKAGYPLRQGHSSGYLAFVDGRYLHQDPSIKDHAFSDRLYLENNNHGRIFGPVRYKNKFWFVAAFSREKVHVDPVGHYYDSFNQARDNFAWKLDAVGDYKVRKFVDLDNDIIDSCTKCSGDHDGIAVYLEAVKK